MGIPKDNCSNSDFSRLIVFSYKKNDIVLFKVFTILLKQPFFDSGNNQKNIEPIFLIATEC